LLEGHPEMAGHLNDVLYAIAAPDVVLQGSSDELLAVVYKHQIKLLAVVYKKDIADGFIITAYFTKKADKFLKRTIIWQK
jgi:hypothetical protein